MNSFSNRLKYALKESNMTMSELSRKTKIGKSSISEWLNGKYEAKQDKVFLLAQALDVDEGWLMGLDVPMRKPKSISNIYNQLEPLRQKKVYSFAEQELEDQNQLHTIEVVGQTAAGEPVTYGDGDTEERQVKHVPEGADCALNVQGDSMEPNC